ncbi:unnamed protein product [Mycena citricolor]|uniref:Chromosome segregation in meiosis protein n=1 Tax=Mycena citricolor TaxID=2018698 RepID=A0AAD2Q595_9AGAR|nr:unnamed protein product [Mycena citricolor]
MSTSALDAIWDADDVEYHTSTSSNRASDASELETPRRQGRASTSKSAQPLFLGDDDDDEMADAPPRRATAEYDDDDDEGMPHSFSGDAAHANAILDAAIVSDDDRVAITSSSPAHRLRDDNAKDGDGVGKDGPVKSKRKIARLDEGRLVAENYGFPRLIQDVKYVKIKGKGHEASDLNRLLQVYQFWTHGLYPKTPFKETVDRVEKLCHSKRMRNKLSEWRDEAHGIVAGEEEATNEDFPSHTGEEPDRVPASDRAEIASSSSRAPTLPPSSEGDHDDDFDVALMDRIASENAKHVNLQDDDIGDDDDMYGGADDFDATALAAAMDTAAEEIAAKELSSIPATAKPTVVDDNDDEWDAIDTM